MSRRPPGRRLVSGVRGSVAADPAVRPRGTTPDPTVVTATAVPPAARTEQRGSALDPTRRAVSVEVGGEPRRRRWSCPGGRQRLQLRLGFRTVGRPWRRICPPLDTETPPRTRSSPCVRLGGIASVVPSRRSRTGPRASGRRRRRTRSRRAVGGWQRSRRRIRPRRGGQPTAPAPPRKAGSPCSTASPANGCRDRLVARGTRWDVEAATSAPVRCVIVLP